MTTLNTKRIDSRPVERFSRRFDNGVEIFEHDTVQTITLDESRFKTSKPRTPRLVINDDAASGANRLISKTRSDVAELAAFLRNVVESPVGPK